MTPERIDETMNNEEPWRECDLVMKGGITSGVVYPPAILKLHEARYRFRRIGGASAGAIAASATAAAQHGEKSGGFARFRKMNEELSTEGLFLKLFQPRKGAQPLLEIGLRIQAKIAGRAKKADPGLTRTILRGLLQLHATARARYQRAYSAGQATGGLWGAIVGSVAGLFVAAIAIAIGCCAIATRGSPSAALAPALVAGDLGIGRHGRASGPPSGTPARVDLARRDPGEVLPECWVLG